MNEVNQTSTVVATFTPPIPPPDISSIWVCEYSASQQSVNVTTLDRAAHSNAQQFKRGLKPDWATMYAGDEENARKVADRLLFVRDEISNNVNG